MSFSFPIENSLKQGYPFSPLLFNFTLKYAIGKEQETILGLDNNGTHQILVYADDVCIKGDISKIEKKRICIIKCL